MSTPHNAHLPAIVFKLKGDESTYQQPYAGYLVAEAVLMQTLLNMGHVMSDVADWGVITATDPEYVLSD